MSVKGQRRSLLAAVALVVAWGAEMAYGSTGQLIGLPLPMTQQQLQNKSRPTVQLSIDCEWAQGYGYRPLWLELSDTASNSDRTFRIEVGLSDWSETTGTSATTTMVLPAGETHVATTLLVPQLGAIAVLRTRVWQDGALAEDLSVDGQMLRNGGQFWGSGDQCPRMLFIGQAAPDVSEFEFLQANLNTYGAMINFNQFADVLAFTHRTPSKLFDQWLAYSALDFVFLSLDDARKLSAKQPAVWQALTHWLRAGETCASMMSVRTGTRWKNLKRCWPVPRANVKRRCWRAVGRCRRKTSMNRT